MTGMEITALRARLRLNVDFRGALGVAAVDPLDSFRFEIEVYTKASETEIAHVKQVADERLSGDLGDGSQSPVFDRRA